MKMNIKIIAFFMLFFITGTVFSQQENVPLENPVYDFLKIMSVKKVIGSINDDNPNMSRMEVAEFVNQISLKENQLSKTEKQLYDKYRIEFIDDDNSRKNTFSLFGGNIYPEYAFKETFTTKQKHLFAFQKNENKIFIDAIGHFNVMGEFQPQQSNSWLFDIGFRTRGTLFNHLGYYFSFVKGGSAGDGELARKVDYRLNYNFNFNANMEKIRNYDFSNAYLRYFIEPSEGMSLSLQFGREPIKYGLGYSRSMTLSGNGPDMDFLKFNFKYGVVNFSSIHASTVGNYSNEMGKRYTKYFAFNRLKLSFDNFFDFGIHEGVVYSGRGVEFGYLLPISFYKFYEMSLQDRDNGVLALDFQSHFLKNVEFQGSFFIDEDPLNYLQDLTLINNKTGYQLGTFIYEPFNFSNLSFIFEYTRIRPYVYTHTNPQNTYTAYDGLLGQPIGPNADQIYAKLNYNICGNMSLWFEYQHIRKGKNILDSLGNVARNVGGDEFFPFRFNNIDNDHPQFLDGIRINTDIFSVNFRFEVIRSFICDINFTYSRTKNLQTNKIDNLSYSFIKVTMDY